MGLPFLLTSEKMEMPDENPPIFHSVFPLELEIPKLVELQTTHQFGDKGIYLEGQESLNLEIIADLRIDSFGRHCWSVRPSSVPLLKFSPKSYLNSITSPAHSHATEQQMKIKVLTSRRALILVF